MSDVRLGRISFFSGAVIAAIAACNALVGNDDVTFIDPDSASADGSADVTVIEGGGDADSGASDGGLVVVASEDDAGIGAVAVTATHVYWSVDGLGQVRRVPKAGGAAETFSTSPPPVGITDFAVGADEIFVNGYGASSAQRLPFSGGNAFLPNGCPGTRLTSGIAFAAPSVYYAVNDCTGAAVPIVLRRASAADTFATATSFVDAGAPGGRVAIAADDGDVLVGSENTLARLAPDLSALRAVGGPYEATTTTGLVVALALDQDKSTVYVRHPTKLRFLSRATLASTGALDVPIVVFFRGQDRSQLAVTDKFVYFGSQSGLFRVSKATRGAEKVFSGAVVGAAADGSRVYFSSESQLYRLGL